MKVKIKRLQEIARNCTESLTHIAWNQLSHAENKNIQLTDVFIRYNDLELVFMAILACKNKRLQFALIEWLMKLDAHIRNISILSSSWAHENKGSLQKWKEKLTQAHDQLLCGKKVEHSVIRILGDTYVEMNATYIQKKYSDIYQKGSVRRMGLEIGKRNMCEFLFTAVQDVAHLKVSKLRESYGVMEPNAFGD